MPRQNEYVNEIWISDKARFGHHFTRDKQNRLLQPMIRQQGRGLVDSDWNEAFRQTADLLKAAGSEVAAIAGSGLSNEDLWTLRRLLADQGSDRMGTWPPTHGGANVVAQVGVGVGTNLSKLGKGDAILVVATNLEEEVPIWYLRLKGAHDRGAYLVVLNARHTRLDDFASESVRYDYPDAANAIQILKEKYPEYAKRLTEANNLIVVAGAEGLTLSGSRALAQSAANFLIESGHVGKPNNGLLSPLPGANGMGQHYLGFTPDDTQDIMTYPPKVLIVAQADLLADDPNAAAFLDKVENVIYLSLFKGEVPAKAAVALPIQSFAERDGSFVNGERRVQRFYVAQGPLGSAMAAWEIFAKLSERLGHGTAKATAGAVMNEISKNVADFASARFPDLAKVERQFPDVGGENLYYGGTAYQNRGGLGVQIPTTADKGESINVGDSTNAAAPKAAKGAFLVVPTTQLYNRERAFTSSELMHARIPAPFVEINSADAKDLKISNGDMVQVTIDNGPTVRATAHVNGGAPKGSIVLPRHLTEEAVPLTISTGSVTKV